MKKNVLVLLILLTPINIVFSQTNNRTDWLDVSENSVNSFLRKYSSNQVVKKNLGQGITVYSVSYRDIDNTSLEHSHSLMFDSGIPINYSSMFFLGEYSNIILISSLNVILFFGGWLNPFFSNGNSIIFAIKTLVFIILFIWARAAFPRYRYDQLIRLGWKIFLPFSISWVILTAGILLGFNWLP